MKAINIEGQKFGYLTALEPIVSSTKTNGRSYKCICDCGTEVIRKVSNLRAGGERQSCGCKYYIFYENEHNLLGDTFGDLTVVQRLGTHKRSKSVLYKCWCGLCGRYIEITSKSLLRKHKLDQNCGCAGTPGKRLPGDRGIFNKLVGTYKSNAKRKNHRFLLSDDMCRELFKGNCFYCGIEPKQIFKHKKCQGEYIYNGIDRLDSAGNYSITNSVSCCKKCNFMKSNYGAKEFIDWIEAVYKNRIQTNSVCNLCNTTLKQIRFNGDDKILSCPACKLGNDSAFEISFDKDGGWLGGYCAAVINNKMLVMRTYPELSCTEIYEPYLNQIYAPKNAFTINSAFDPQDLRVDKMELCVLFS